MLNREKYTKEILNIACSGSAIAVVNGVPMNCRKMDCALCDLYNNGCYNKVEEWANSEYVESLVDWNKVAVDTPILVKNYETEQWYKRYFAKYEDGKVATWRDGRTSWNAGGYVQKWSYAKLAESDNE